jgi:hypothetical protein
MNTSIALLAVPVALTIGFVAGRLDTSAVEASSTVLGRTVLAQEAAAAQEMSPEQLAYFMPGEHHKLLEVFVGSWDAAVEMAGPEGAMTVQGAMEARLVMGGRYLQQDFTADMMGMPFEGMSLMGYDGLGKVFESIWIDNSTTDLMTSTGFAAPDGVNFTMLSEEVDQATMTKREVELRTRVVSRDEIVYEHWSVGADGTQSKTLSITYKRKAAR